MNVFWTASSTALVLMLFALARSLFRVNADAKMRSSDSPGAIVRRLSYIMYAIVGLAMITRYFRRYIYI